MARRYNQLGGRTTVVIASCVAVACGLFLLLWRSLPDPVPEFDPAQRVAPMFVEPDRPVEVRLEADFAALARGPQGARVRFLDLGQERTARAELIPRGNARAKICPFKPFFLRWDLAPPAPFAPLGKKIKWVAHCGRDQGDLDLQTERLRYRIVEVLGLPALRTQRIRVAYESGERRVMEAFWVERPSGFAARTGWTRIEPSADVAWPVRARLLLAERAIGNTDFQIERGVNVLHFRTEDGDLRLVGYDFDVHASPWVDATRADHQDWFDSGGPSPGVELADTEDAEVRQARRAALVRIAAAMVERKPAVLSVIAMSGHPEQAKIAGRIEAWFDFVQGLTAR